MIEIKRHFVASTARRSGKPQTRHFGYNLVVNGEVVRWFEFLRDAKAAAKDAESRGR